MALQQAHPMQVLHRGVKSDAARAPQAATSRRLQRRHLSDVALDGDGIIGAKTMAAVMTDEQRPDLTGEQEREQEAATSGIEVRTVV
jgi:lysozyme family protein